MRVKMCGGTSVPPHALLFSVPWVAYDGEASGPIAVEAPRLADASARQGRNLLASSAGRPYPLTEAPEALAYLGEGHAKAK